MDTYLDKLRTSAEKANSIVCMGLDPVPKVLPTRINGGFNTEVISFFQELFTYFHTNNLSPAAFKPNQGFYVKHDDPLNQSQSILLETVGFSPASERFYGSDLLAHVKYSLLDKQFPDIPVILDSKRGDIDKSSANYAEEGFVRWKADAVTISPYMGGDSVMPFIEYTNQGKGVYILNRTSNPGAKDFQNLDVVVSKDVEGRPVRIEPLYQVVAGKIIEWSQFHPGVGAVVGATSLDELRKLAHLYANAEIPMLIPGVGGQGGSARDVANVLRDEGYDLRLARINSSSGLTHPWKKGPAPEDYVKRCVDEFVKLNEEIGPIR